MADHTDGIGASTVQLVEGAVGAAGVAGSCESSIVCRRDHLSLVRA